MKRYGVLCIFIIAVISISYPCFGKDSLFVKDKGIDEVVFDNAFIFSGKYF